MTIEHLLTCLFVGVAVASALWLIALFAWLACRTIARILRRARSDLAALRRTREDVRHIRDCEAMWQIVHQEYRRIKGWAPPVSGGYPPAPPDPPDSHDAA